jgi:hypothetical protein
MASSSSSTSNIHHATYPLPQPLALLLLEASSTTTTAHKESKETALSQILSNALQAIDRLYFSESSTNRTSDWFVHRTCLRISVAAPSTNSSITITDLGTGMTRGDLINALGIGRLSRKAAQYVVKHNNRMAASQQQQDADESDNGPATPQDSENEDVGVVAVTKEEEDGETVDTDDDEDGDTSDNDDDDDDDDSLLPCTEADIGGFYAALCALGVGVTIGTKVSCTCSTCSCCGFCLPASHFLFTHSHHTSCTHFVTSPYLYTCSPNLMITMNSLTAKHPTASHRHHHPVTTILTLPLLVPWKRGPCLRLRMATIKCIKYVASQARA